MEFKSFSRQDWDAFSGAESFADGTAPLTAEVEIVGCPDLVLAVVDRSGVELCVAGMETVVRFQVPDAMLYFWTPAVAKAFALEAFDKTWDELVANGFSHLG